MGSPNIVWSSNGEDDWEQELYDVLENKELQIGDKVYFGEAIKPKHSEYLRMGGLLDCMQDLAFYDADDLADDYAKVSPDAETELHDLILAWMEKHLTINWYRVENVNSRILTAEDFD